MGNVERTRVREREPGPADNYEITYNYLMKLRDRSFNGTVVVEGDKRPWEPGRQGRFRWYLSRENDMGMALKDWNVFINDIQRHSGKHRHQGGIVIFVLEGKGYSIVDGEQIEWQEGDMILLPLKPDGVVHQHFNHDQGKGCKWIAFYWLPYQDSVAMYLEQQESRPDFQG